MYNAVILKPILPKHLMIGQNEEFKHISTYTSIGGGDFVFG